MKTTPFLRLIRQNTRLISDHISLKTVPLLVDFRKVLRTISGSGAPGAFGARFIRYIWFICAVSALFNFLSCSYIVPSPKILASRLVASLPNGRHISFWSFWMVPPKGGVSREKQTRVRHISGIRNHAEGIFKGRSRNFEIGDGTEEHVYSKRHLFRLFDKWFPKLSTKGGGCYRVLLTPPLNPPQLCDKLAEEYNS